MSQPVHFRPVGFFVFVLFIFGMYDVSCIYLIIGYTCVLVYRLTWIFNQFCILYFLSLRHLVMRIKRLMAQLLYSLNHMLAFKS